MGIAVSKVTAGALNELPYVLNGRFDMQDAAHAVAVIEVGDDFKVGRYGDWQGRYWALERSTTILYFADSAKELREWIKLCRQASNS